MADTYLPPGFKKCKSCQQVKPFEQFGKSSRASLASRVNAERVLARKTKRTQQAQGPK